MTRRSPGFAALAGLVLAGFAAACTGGADGSATAGADRTAADDLGKTLAGEACRSALRQGPLAVPSAPPPLDVFCGDGKQAVGAVWTDALPLGTPRAGAERRTAVERVARETLEGKSIAQRMICGPAEALGGDGDVLVYSCTLRVANWPQIVLVTATGTALYQAEGLPSMLPVLAKATGRAAGTPVITGDAEAALQRLEASLGADTGRIASTDLVRFNEFMRVGRIANSTRNFSASEDAFRRALEVQTRVFGPDWAGGGDVLIELALAVSNQGRYEEAAALFRRAEPIVAKGDEAIRARFYAYLALDAANQHKDREALGDAQQSTALRRQQIDSAADAIADITAADPHIGAKGELVHSLTIEAALAFRLGNIASAKAAISEALQMLAEVKGLPLWWRPEAILLLGQIEAAEGHTASAERNLLLGASIEQKIFGRSAPTARAYLILARFYNDQEDHAQSVAAFRAATAILARDDTARAALAPDQIIPFLSSASVLGERQPDLRPMLDGEMFRATQLIGSTVTDQTIARASARLASADPAIAALIRDEQEAERARDAARIALANEQAKPDDQRGSVVETALAKESEAAAAKADALQRQLQEAFPTYASFAEPDAVELGTLQQRLEPDEAFLAFAIGRDRSYAILIRHDRFIARPVAATEESLAADVADLRKALTPRAGVLPEYDLRAAHALYRTLLGPVEAELRGIRHLIAAPTGALASLPLALLVVAPPAPGAEHAYARAEWLIRRAAVSEVPSARAFLDLRLARAQAKPAPRPFLGVGNPIFQGSAGSALDRLAASCREQGPVPPELIRALAPLPETADEVRRVGQRLGADPAAILLGAAATEANLRRQPLGDYNVLYFATHGLLPGELRCASEPGLALTPPSGAAESTDDDGLLDASEVARLRLNADLVVLSACNTAAGGGRFGGEALSGLAEAFFHAGARTLVVSHWQVASNATVELMTGLFERLGPRMGGGLADSLRQAQLALAGEPQTAHPFYWAAFTVIGDGGLPGAGSGRIASSGAVGADAPR